MIEAVREHLRSVICVVRAQSIINGSAAAAAAAHVCAAGQAAGRSRREPDPLTGYYYSDTFPIHNTHTHTHPITLKNTQNVYSY